MGRLRRAHRAGDVLGGRRWRARRSRRSRSAGRCWRRCCVAAVAAALLALALDSACCSSGLRKQGAITLVIASFGAALGAAQPAAVHLRRRAAVLLAGAADRAAAAAAQRGRRHAHHAGPAVRAGTDRGDRRRGCSSSSPQHARPRDARDVAQPQLARVTGIDPERVLRATWVIGGVLAAVAGVFAGLTVQLRPTLGLDLLLPLFAAVILGGIGSVWGAVLGGLIVGIAESAAVSWIGAEYRAATAFAVLIAILLVRPNGLFGRTPLMPRSRRLAVVRHVLPRVRGHLRGGRAGLEPAVGLHRPVQRRRRRLRRGRRLHVGASSPRPTRPSASAASAGRWRPAGWPRWRRRGSPGCFVGALALRLRNDYLAITTFGIAVTIQLVATNAQALTGGPFGVQFIPKPLQGWLGSGLAWNAGVPGHRGRGAGGGVRGARKVGAQPMGPRAARDPRRRGRRGVARQARVRFQAAELRDRQHADGPGRRAATRTSSATSRPKTSCRSSPSRCGPC